ncbi:MAG: 50S ribosomal protein L29 [Gammaproteobacteria bacterium]|nr:50S ribosomal protein L29 [Gammaproteobacteria bacterium]
MKLSELKIKSITALKEELHALLKEQFSLRMQKGSGETPRTHSFRVVRRNIARIKTILNEKGRESHE